jgi:hypothetical protein
VRIVTFRGFGWEVAHSGRYATPADSPRHDGTPYRELRVRRWGLGFVHHSRVILCRAVPSLTFRFAHVSSLYAVVFDRPHPVQSCE